MEVVLLALIVIGILLAIASGIWVAIALVRAISAHRAEPFVRRQGDEENANEDR
ncbi:MAG: hypothetical protein ACYS83_05630 [Planctomycetota bacterium]|jgi:uncharacterized membrane protein YphA (DoxX/SURF4 family)